MERQNNWLEEALKTSEERSQEGDIVTGKIVGITKDGLVVAVGLKSEGLIPINDFDKDEQDFKIGDSLEVLLVRKESKSGQALLSYQQAREIRRWDKLEQAYKQNAILDGVIKRKVKGGVNVAVFDNEVFMPASQVGLSYIKDLATMIDQAVRVRIIKFDRMKMNVVVSQRVILEEEMRHKKEILWAELQEGQVRKGWIKNITEFGAFIDLGGSEGLLHINDISWGKVKKVSDILKGGEEIEVKVLQVDRINEKIALGLKQLSQDPWLSVKQKYPVAAVVSGKVVSLADFGAFVELEEGLEGLIHVSEMSWVEYVKHPSKIMKVGDVVQAKVLASEEEKRKLSLGLKQIQPNPWANAAVKYKTGSRVTGVVSHLSPFGAFVKLEDGIEGLIHVSDLSWQEKISHPKKILKENDKIEALVLRVDAKEEKLSLGFKQLQENPAAGYKVGEIIEAEITEIVEQGLVVKVGPQLRGFIHISQITGEFVEKPTAPFKVGQIVTAKIVKIDAEEAKLSLSIKEYEKGVKKETVAKYTKTSEQKVTFGDVLGDQLAKFRQKE
ncbi:MAG: 30S ribosomal protein S1 [Elusimicrobia bacterium]|nr:30S ribosomal protein S1 [Elusimicrobiota bacterium]